RGHGRRLGPRSARQAGHRAPEGIGRRFGAHPGRNTRKRGLSAAQGIVPQNQRGIPMKLYGYFRSSAAYRVRIALNLKGLPYESVSVHLMKDGGQQLTDYYRALNPTALVPTLVDGDLALGQSMAIMEYLEETHP